MSDPSELRQALCARLCEQPELLDALTCDAQGGMWSMDLGDPAGDYVSDGLWHVLGYRSGQRRWRDHVDASELDVALQWLRVLRPDDGPTFDSLLRHRHRDGTTRFIRFRGVVEFDADGAPTRVIGYHTDQTAQVVADAERSHLAAELTRLNSELETFTYSVAHDLRGPLQVIAGFVEVCLLRHGEQLDPDAAYLLREVASNAARMGELMDGLLLLADIDREPRHVVAVDMAAVVRRAIEDARASQPDTQAEIVVQALPTVPGDLGMLRRVWTHLIDNALQYSAFGDAPRIEIGADVDGREARFTIRDNGLGFSPSSAGEVFEPFVRLHPTQAKPGLGVGLAAVRRIVARHGGMVWADGEPGQGACFGFSLPRGAAFTADPTASAAE